MNTPLVVSDILYWLFLVVWSLFAAYLLVVRRTHIALAGYLDAIFFAGEGELPAVPDEHPPRLFRAPHSSLGHGAHAHDETPHAEVVHPDASNELVDDFIVSQIERTK